MRMKEGKNTFIVIPTQPLILFLILPILGFVVWYIRDILFSLLIAFIIMSSLRPGVAFLTAKKVPRPLAIGITFTFFILFFVSLISLIIPPIVIETTNLIQNLPIIIDTTIPYFQETTLFDNWTSYIPNVTNNIFGVVSAVFSNTLFIMTTLFFGLYFLLEENLASRFFHHYFPKQTADRIVSTFQTAEKRMSSWFWGELTLMIVVGTMTYIGLTLIGVKYALPLAILAGLLEVVPNIGPVISAIPAIIIGFSQSVFAGFSSLALYIVVQQLENNLIVPVIMRRAVGINPILTLLALLIGGRVGGVLGILLAVPLFLFIETIIHEYVRPHYLSGVKEQVKKD